MAYVAAVMPAPVSVTLAMRIPMTMALAVPVPVSMAVLSPKYRWLQQENRNCGRDCHRQFQRLLHVKSPHCWSNASSTYVKCERTASRIKYLKSGDPDGRSNGYQSVQGNTQDALGEERNRRDGSQHESCCANRSVLPNRPSRHRSTSIAGNNRNSRRMSHRNTRHRHEHHLRRNERPDHVLTACLRHRITRRELQLPKKCVLPL